MGSNKQIFSEITPIVEEYLLPEIKLAVEVCKTTYHSDDYNDIWTFGTHVWKNIWNRIRKIASDENIPIELYGSPNEFKFSIKSLVFHHHRIDSKTDLPKAAKSAKQSADARQLSMFQEFDLRPENFILAIDADPTFGLKRVFIGELARKDELDKKYFWKETAAVFISDVDFEGGSDFYVTAEEDVYPIVALQPLNEKKEEM